MAVDLGIWRVERYFILEGVELVLSFPKRFMRNIHFLAFGDDILSIALRFTFEDWFNIELLFPWAISTGTLRGRFQMNFSWHFDCSCSRHFQV